jgi:hypothetical protein
MTAKGAVATFDVDQAEIRKRQEEQFAAEQAFLRRSTFSVTFRREGDEIRLRAYWPAPVGGPESSVDRPATDADFESYPAEYAAFKNAEAASVAAKR